MQKEDRIIIDTNLWISFLLTRQFNFLDDLLEKGQIRLLFSQELLSEFLEVVDRPKFKKFFHEKDLRILMEFIEQYAEFIDVVSKAIACRDEKDNFLLSLAIDGSANYLITGDKDLLDLKRFGKTRIITFAEYKILKVSGS